MNAYRLAICEDDDVTRKELHSLCHDILTEDGIGHEIMEFLSAQELERVLTEESDPFDLLLLDIKMEGMTGMELAQLLRRRGDRVSIVFITGDENYLPEGYSVQPIHFLLKPISKGALANALRIDWKINQQLKTVILRIGCQTVSLPLADIRYIESYNHNIIVHQTEGDRSYRFSLSKIEQQLPPGGFFRCHNSFLVNMQYIEEISRTELLLRGGIRLPIGRTYYKSLQSAFIRYINQ